MDAWEAVYKVYRENGASGNPTPKRGNSTLDELACASGCPTRTATLAFTVPFL